MPEVLPFEARIKVLIDRVGSAEKLAKKSGVSARNIGKYLKGESDPSRMRLVKMAQAGGVSVEWLATGEEPTTLTSHGADLAGDPAGQYVCNNPIHQLENRAFPKELDPELLDRVGKAINQAERQVGKTVPTNKAVDLLMVAYADAYWRGRNVNLEMIIKLVELTV